jgi:hypothetical protein
MLAMVTWANQPPQGDTDVYANSATFNFTRGTAGSIFKRHQIDQADVVLCFGGGMAIVATG